MKTRFAFIHSALLLLCFVTETSFAQSKPLTLTVSSFFWSNSVDRAPQVSIEYTRSGSPVYLWLNLRGDQMNQRMLRDKSPVYFKWFRYSSYGLDPEIEGITSSKQLIPARGNNFSVWTGFKSVKRPGKYVVKVVYANNAPLMCGELPCEYTITVK